MGNQPKNKTRRGQQRISIPLSEAERADLATVARSFGYSTQQFVRILLSFAKRSPEQILTHIRMLKAVQPK